jgi:hypothetical protein
MPDDSPRGCPASPFPAAGADMSTPPHEAPLCSARGCSTPAGWELRWNNPKVHSPDRRKVWLACDDHKQSLAAFLSARGFFRDAVPFRPSDTYSAPSDTYSPPSDP